MVITVPYAYTRCDVPKKTTTKKDRRSRQDLEIFILALVSEGVASTPYDLMASAKISPGASIPALGRLETSGYVRKGDEGPRRRAQYVSTAKGELLLQTSWRELFSEPPQADQDLDAILRISSLALLMGEEKLSVVAYLTAAARERLTRIAEETKSVMPQATTKLDFFLWMRGHAKLARMRNEASTLKRLASSLRRVK